MTDDELRKLAEAALEDETRILAPGGSPSMQAELARAVLRLLEDKAQAHWAMKAKAAECCDGWKRARQHDYGCPYMAWAKADREHEWRERALAAEKKLAALEEERRQEGMDQDLCE